MNRFCIIVFLLLNVQLKAKMYDESYLYDCKNENNDANEEANY